MFHENISLFKANMTMKIQVLNTLKRKEIVYCTTFTMTMSKYYDMAMKIQFTYHNYSNHEWFLLT